MTQHVLRASILTIGVLLAPACGRAADITRTLGISATVPPTGRPGARAQAQAHAQSPAPVVPPVRVTRTIEGGRTITAWTY